MDNTKEKKIRVLIADDSVLMRLLIKDILIADAEIEVVGHANNGKEAFLLTRQLKPDVVLMDLTMGEYGGLYGVENIMKECPTPIIILSAMGNTDMEPILKALKTGAVDYLNKPVKNNVNLREVGGELIEKVKIASKAALNQLLKNDSFSNVHHHAFDGNVPYDIIIIGASTGGPTAVETVLTQLPQNINVPVIIVQHMPSNFILQFAKRLDSLTPLDVKVAESGETLLAGKVYLAPGDTNMVVQSSGKTVTVGFTEQKYLAYNDPSIDSVMLSAAKVYGKRCIGVILTGMGKDGAMGMAAIKKAGGYTIAQHQDSCVVYGMPRAVVESDSAKKIVHLKDIAVFLVSCLS